MSCQIIAQFKKFKDKFNNDQIFNNTDILNKMLQSDNNIKINIRNQSSNIREYQFEIKILNTNIEMF